MKDGGEARPVFPLGSATRLPVGGTLPDTEKRLLRPSALDEPVSKLQGVGRRTQARLRDLGILTMKDLLEHFPFRHEEAADFLSVDRLRENEEATIRVRVQSSSLRRTRRPGLKLLEAIVGDESGSVRAVWYNQGYLLEAFERRPELLIRGRLVRGRGDLSFRVRTHEILGDGDDASDGVHTMGLVPVYPATGDLSVRLLRTLLSRALPAAIHLIDPLPAREVAARGYPSRREAVAGIHFPSDLREARTARQRLAFEELVLLQTALLGRRLQAEVSRRARRLSPPGGLSGRYLGGLAFSPTAAQRRVMAEIDIDLAAPRPMRRLLQGDVGSGKTLVAAYALLRAVEEGGQAVLMAPTEVLVDQHGARLGEEFARLGVDIAALKGSLPAAERRRIIGRIGTGEVQVVVGTHALIQEGVSFADLRVAVVDEQHRFGVEQREALVRPPENRPWPHVLHMTATPIPRTLSLTLYGDLDLSVIDELPPGRTPVRTRLVQEKDVDKMWAFTRAQLDEGRQAYVVCPLIDESEALCVASATSTYAELSSGPFASYRMGLLHGQMTAAEKQEIMARFGAGDVQVLVSTTVIEVGIDVPNASVMVIEGARRFGLSQLHQLRGRVGRGASESFCLLRVGEGDDEEATKRLALFARTTDGFALAEADLSLRGEGQLFGQRQSGIGDLKVARLLRDGRLLEQARELAQRVLEADPGLEHPEHRFLAEAASDQFGSRTDWLDRV